ncbi:MAG TPA: TIGR03435 family protein [Bryobacteraceae bacterium]|jgi:uncharacterized protein (TIGR03435 family)|nr:TIGR03435 family protein [Bryobacteraceae bacterium]
MIHRAVKGTSMIVFTCAALWAQTPEASPTFEVASVKPAAPQTGGMRVMMRGGPGSPDPGQLTYENASLKNVLMNAYGVKNFQISGPAWLDTERFDIVAKIPKDATKEQFKLMLQNLLAERFKLTVHHETKDMPMFALVVGKNGPKMKESEDPPPTDGAPATGGPAAPSATPPAGGPAFGTTAPPPPPPPGPLQSGAMGRMAIGKDGFPQMPGGAKRPGTWMMFSQGRFRMTANMQTMPGFADMLTGQLGRPVTDMTGLKGKYDFSLDFAPDESMRMMGPMGPLPAPMPAGGGGGGADGAGPLANASDSQGPTLFTAVQEQLGLKLEQKKGPMDILVIDHLEKVPTEN